MLPYEDVCDCETWIRGMDVFRYPDTVKCGEDGADEAESEGADDGGFDVHLHLEGVDEDDGEGDVDDFEDGVEADDKCPA